MQFGFGPVAPLMVIATMWWALRGARRPSRIVSGRRIVEYPSGMKALGFIALVTSSYLCIRSMFGGAHEKLFLGYFMLPFVAGAAAVFLE